jgi:predicted Zn-dependent protease
MFSQAETSDQLAAVVGRETRHPTTHPAPESRIGALMGRLFDMT